jgi:hypothetical protein
MSYNLSGQWGTNVTSWPLKLPSTSLGQILMMVSKCMDWITSTPMPQ